MQLRILTLLCALNISVGFAQVRLPVPRDIQTSYAKSIRTENGKPGVNYWQNRANYTIKAAFNPGNRVLQGYEDIQYTNNSPDTLSQIWFKLYPNYYKKGSPRDSKVAASDQTEGVTITELSVENNHSDVNLLKADGTNLTVPISALLPGKTVNIHVTYSYELNKGSHNRMGQVDDGSYFLAYFFPRIAVYDDIDGWNKNPYLGSAEFYNDFCDFKAELTLPENYVVWATGTLTNQSEVFTPSIDQRINQSEKLDAVTTIITESDLQKNAVTTNNHTWRFEASNVTDFVFATSNHYVWNASSLVVDPQTGRRTRVDAAFNPIHKDYFDVVNYARKTVESMSYKFPKWPFPYPHETVFDGLDQMEYPMMVNDNPVTNKTDAITLTDHEIFHTMFPFYMGINETKYGWMDEGWATIGEWLISPMIDSTIVDEYGVAPYERAAGKELDSPIMTLTTQQSGTAFYLNSYPKPAFGYLYVKDLIGDELFTKALHYYIEQWHGKHPIPYDFFNCMNTGSGQNLNWFWKAWFFDNGYPDLAISNVVTKGSNVQITVQMKGTKPTPVDLVIHFKNGSTEKLHKSIAAWKDGNKFTTLNYTTSKKIRQITLGSTYTPDIHQRDNTFNVKN